MSTTREQSSKPTHRGRGLFVGLVFTGVVSAFVLAWMLQIAVAVLRSGHGLETYRTFWLVEFNWVGFLTFAACLAFALLAGLVIRWHHRRRERAEWRELEQLPHK